MFGRSRPEETVEEAGGAVTPPVTAPGKSGHTRVVVLLDTVVEIFNEVFFQGGERGGVVG